MYYSLLQLINNLKLTQEYNFYYIDVHYVGCLQFDQLFLILALLLAHDSHQLAEYL